jgi:hypothetical protein
VNVYDKAISYFKEISSSDPTKRGLYIYKAAKAFGLSSSDLSKEMRRRAKISRDAKSKQRKCPTQLFLF